MSTDPRGGSRLAVQVALILAIFALFIASLERKAPYYFLQDDNRDALLPLFVTAHRSLLNRELAQINYHQALGTPLLANGHSSVLLPAPSLAIALSRIFWGHDFAAIDILVALYLAAGGMGWLFFARQLRLGRLAATVAALSWMLLPFNVYASVSWVIIATLAAFLPWMFGLTIGLLRSPRPGVWVAFVAVHVLFLLSGFMQGFIYACLFEVAFAALLSLVARWSPAASTAKRGAAYYLVALAAVPVLGLPLLLPMWNAARHSAGRSGPLTYALFADNNVRPSTLLNGLLVPWTRLVEPSEDHYFTEQVGPPAMAHLGYPALGLALLAIIRRRRLTADQRAATVAAGILLLIALLWALGLLSLFLYHVPVLNLFRWPFKLLAFSGFFTLLLAAVGLDSLAGDARGRSGRAGLLALVAVQVGGLWIANLSHEERGFYQHLDRVPLQEPLLDRLRHGRLFSIGFAAGPGPPSRTAPGLGFDYASLWGLQHFSGYDSLMPRENFKATLSLFYDASFHKTPADLPVDYLRIWGVRHYLVHPSRNEEFDPALRAQGFRVVADAPERRVYEDPLAVPLAFWANDVVDESLALEFRGNRAIVAAEAPQAKTLIVSLLFQPFYEATLDGRPHAIQRTEQGQIAVEWPAGRHELVLRYSDPFFRTGVSLAGAAAGALAIAYMLLRRRLRAL